MDKVVQSHEMAQIMEMGVVTIWAGMEAGFTHLAEKECPHKLALG